MLTHGHRLRRGHWVYSLLAIVAMAAQIVVALAPLTESRDQRMASHVEAGGAQTHHAHNEADCAACQARAIQGTAPRDATPVVAVASHVAVPQGDAVRIAAGPTHSSSKPRAPPSLI